MIHHNYLVAFHISVVQDLSYIYQQGLQTYVCTVNQSTFVYIPSSEHGGTLPRDALEDH